MKKLLVVGVLLLFLGMSISSSTGFNVVEQSNTTSSNGKTLYVGGSGPNNYTKIQDAIDDASDGDTVFVYDDSSPYYENLKVNKSINLIGEDRGTTVIDGNKSGNVIYISTNLVSIRGFTINNSGYKIGDSGIYIKSNHTTITSNTILTNDVGIFIEKPSHSNIIIGNNIHSNINYDAFGIFLFYTDFNTISGNTILLHWIGIVLDRSNNNTISSNKVSSSKQDDGITLVNSNNNSIIGNNISNNDYGIEIVGNSRFNTIKSNSISNNNDGIFIGTYYGSPSIDELFFNSIYNNILKNNFLSNKRDAFFRNSRLNQWGQNYWNGARDSPKLIFGEIGFVKFYGTYWYDFHIPWIPQVDWFPAQVPYDIEV